MNVENILTVYRDASPSEVEFGATWYNQAHKQCYALGQKHGLSTYTVIGIVAALSPNCAWAQNLVDAEKLITLKQKARVTSYPLNKEKALRILAGEKPLHVLRGPKVRSFYKCIARPQTTNSVCVDFHGMNICEAQMRPLSQTPGLTPKRYLLYADTFRDAARSLGLPPHVLQATCWLVWRRMSKTPNQKMLF